MSEFPTLSFVPSYSKVYVDAKLSLNMCSYTVVGTSRKEEKNVPACS